MGKYLERFSNGIGKIDKKIRDITSDKTQETWDRGQEENKFEYGEQDFDEKEYGDWDNFDDVGIQPAQKPESFHHFILENQYKDLERSIRGFKDVFDKKTQQWVIKRKAIHCFTDEEAEGILRMAQSHLATDIKLASMSLEAFGKMMDLLYEQLENYFYRIAEYRYGRYGKDNYDLQGKMKDENKKILIELYNRIWANYSRAIGGKENRYTHESVKGQESLQQTENDFFKNKRYS